MMIARGVTQQARSCRGVAVALAFRLHSEYVNAYAGSCDMLRGAGETDCGEVGCAAPVEIDDYRGKLVYRHS